MTYTLEECEIFGLGTAEELTVWEDLKGEVRNNVFVITENTEFQWVILSICMYLFFLTKDG